MIGAILGIIAGTLGLIRSLGVADIDLGIPGDNISVLAGLDGVIRMILVIVFAILLLAVYLERIEIKDKIIYGIVVIILGVLVAYLGGVLAIIGGILIIADNV